jgi:hypothetical protein
VAPLDAKAKSRRVSSTTPAEELCEFFYFSLKVDKLTLHVLNPKIHSIHICLVLLFSGIFGANILVTESPSFARVALLKLDGLWGGTPHRCRATTSDLAQC